MKKAVHDCLTGEVAVVDMTPAEEAKLFAHWAEPRPGQVKTDAEKIAELEARLAALETVKTR